MQDFADADCSARSLGGALDRAWRTGRLGADLRLRRDAARHLNHTTSSAIAKVLKEKGGLNTLVQATAGETVMIAIVNRGEADFAMANAPEIGALIASNQDLRMIGPIYTLKTGFWVRKDSGMQMVSDLKGKRVTMGYSAMRALDPMSRAILAAGGLTENDIKPVLVPNVVRSATTSPPARPTCSCSPSARPRCARSTSRWAARASRNRRDARHRRGAQDPPFGYLSDIAPGPIFVGVEKPMKTYTIDNILFTHAKMPDDVVYKMIETMENNKADMIAVAPTCASSRPPRSHKHYQFPIHPGALKYFKDKNIAAKPSSEGVR